ncbi:FadR/GntR family transcriptional regulator [Clostridium sp. KNHs216]|uniref:FadR/GntR family transcriptional regulator n=1 Tax=Clostridium sp. KNHs216 TaxID=1550235 RepID=UPI00114EBFBE|nr:FadR/GntR family transcriptional regulator [Clostridium sp. KNHs216]TQI67824.1 GntR family transcriptional repressor for pyruvate dehydrogenase complex [Clostridium sp. KNHs216]
MNDDGKAYLKVIRYIQQQLASDQLRMGNKLPTERELSEILNLSRNSIREAMSTMENMGFVESRQGSGNYLTGNIEKSFTTPLSMMVLMKQVNYIEINQLRRGIELQALTLAMNRITDDELEKIKAILTKMEHSPKSEESVYDKEFHDAIVAASGNELMVSVMQALSLTCEEAIKHILSQELDGKRRLLMKSHRQIYKSLLHRDLQSGAESVNIHYDIIDTGLKISQKS